MIDLSYYADGDTLVLQLRGVLDDQTVVEAERQIAALFAAKQKRWIVDLGGITHVSGNGLRVLRVLAKRLKARRGRLVLCSPQGDVAEALAISGLNRIFRIVASVSDALQGALTISDISGSFVVKEDAGRLAAEAVADVLTTSAAEPSPRSSREVDAIADAVLRLLQDDERAEGRGRG